MAAPNSNGNKQETMLMVNNSEMGNPLFGGATPASGSNRNNCLQHNLSPTAISIADPFSSAAPSSSSTHLTLDRVRSALHRQQSAPPNNAHRGQFDQLLRGQQEQMREVMLERGYNTLLAAAKEAVVKGLREKDAEVRHAVRRAGRLQNRLSELQIENLAMEAKAMEQETAIAALQTRLRAKEMEGSGESDDAESCYVDPERTRVRFRGLAGICRECQERAATVVILPCKHLCLCVECNEEVAPVPCHVCRCIRSGCVQIFLD